jgi:hypothetical protein
VATYLDLRTRIINETNRDDLTDVLAGQLVIHIAQAIDFYASRRFWFNEGIKTAACVVGNEYVTKPTGLRVIDRATVTVGSFQNTLRERPLTYIDALAAVASSGQPTEYAELGDTIRLWPKPNATYPLGFVGIVDLPALVNDGDSNAWTIQGYSLITARTKWSLFANQFYDDGKAGSAKAEETDALMRLSGETARRLSSGVRAYG